MRCGSKSKDPTTPWPDSSTGYAPALPHRQPSIGSTLRRCRSSSPPAAREGHLRSERASGTPLVSRRFHLTWQPATRAARRSAPLTSGVTSTRSPTAPTADRGGPSSRTFPTIARARRCTASRCVRHARTSTRIRPIDDSTPNRSPAPHAVHRYGYGGLSRRLAEIPP